MLFAVHAGGFCRSRTHLRSWETEKVCETIGPVDSDLSKMHEAASSRLLRFCSMYENVGHELARNQIQHEVQ